VQDVEFITARGTGYWGEAYRFDLVTRTVTHWDSSREECVATTTFEVAVDDARVGGRTFPSEAARAAFFAEQFSNVEVHPLDPPEVRERRHVIAACIGEQVSSLTFVANYAQLRFNTANTATYPTLNLYVWPVLLHEATLLRQTEAGYLDALVDLIGVSLSGVDELLDLGLVLDFANGQRLVIPLDGSGLEGGYEIAEFASDGPLVVWRPNEPPISWGQRTT
jgi:hypothetical protein